MFLLLPFSAQVSSHCAFLTPKTHATACERKYVTGGPTLRLVRSLAVLKAAGFVAHHRRGARRLGAMTDWFTENLEPTLTAGCVALSREKPADPHTWLANWLLANKPPKKLQASGTAAALQALVATFESPEGKAELQALFDLCDKDGDGHVTSKEWGKAISANWKTMAKYFGGLTIAEVGKAFKRLDADGSGDLTWDEFEGAIATMDMSLRLAQTLETEEGKAELRALFDTLDKDGDGRVTGKEWGSAVYKNQDMIKKYFGGKNIKQIGKAFSRIDADGSDDLTWDEFVAASQRIVSD